MDYEQFVKEHPKVVESDPIHYPPELTIATITLTCSIPVTFITKNISLMLPLSPDFINSVKWGNSSEILRQIIPSKKKKKVTKKMVNKNNFYNQVSISIISPQNVEGKFIKMNIKLFNSGAIQVTGCKKISYFFWAIDRLFKMLQVKQFILEDDVEKEIELVRPAYFLHIMGLNNVKIGMINNVFFAGFKINREKLYDYLVKDKFEVTFDQSRAPSLNMKYMTVNMRQPITILVFRTGKCMITGMGSYANIIECYKFINEYFGKHYDAIVHND